MTFGSIVALFSAMIVLASIPSVSVLTVTTRTLAYGFIHGLITTLGIVLGDVMFILIALSGLSFLADSMAGALQPVKYLGAVYLAWLGLRLWRVKSVESRSRKASHSSLDSSFLAGLLITLGDQKVILFYFAFFPSFIDVAELTRGDIIIVLVIDIVALCAAKFCYAYLAHKSTALCLNTRARQGLNQLAAGVMFAVALFIVIKT